MSTRCCRAVGVALGAILAMTALVRLYRLDLTWFFLDQARDVTIAAAIARGEALPLLGPRIGWTDAYLGPLYYYLLALPFLATGAPLAGAAFVAASNVLAVFLLYRFARSFWGESAALTAAALFGVFPLAVWSARLVWTIGLLPLFTVLFMRSLFALAVEGRSAAAIPMLALLGVLPQLHLTTIAFAPVALLALVAARRQVEWRHVAIGTALCVALYAPYLAHEAAHGFENVHALSTAAAGDGRATPAAIAAVLLNALRLYQPALAGFLSGEGAPSALPAAARALLGIEAILFGAGVLVAITRILHRGVTGRAPVGAARAHAFLLIWLAVPLLTLGARSTPMWWYYFDLLYPSQFILVGIALSSLVALAPGRGPARRAVVGAAVGLVAALAVSQAALVVAFQRQVARDGELVIDIPQFPINDSSSPFGRLASLPLGLRSRIIDVLREDFGIGPDEFATRVHGGVLGLPEENDYLLRYLERRAPARPPDAGDAHYVVARGGGLDPRGRRSARVGPYQITEYPGAIDRAAWMYGTVAPGQAGSLPTRWAPVGPTWPRLEADTPEGGALVLRGTLRAPAAAPPPVLAVGVMSWSRPDAIQLAIDGVPARRLAQALRQDPLMLPLGARWLMGVGWSAEAIFAPAGPVAAGEHAIEVRLTGAGRTIRIDVFECG